jgi:hypothetical protein
MGSGGRYKQAIEARSLAWLEVGQHSGEALLVNMT